MICDPDVWAPYDLPTGEPAQDLTACLSSEGDPTSETDFRSVTGRTK